jgi:hypothetical protein
MPAYLDLERRFGLLTKYSVEELLVIDVMGRKRLDWKQVLAGTPLRMAAIATKLPDLS